jgi:hypothetical protein
MVQEMFSRRRGSTPYGVRRVAGASLSTARAVRVKRCWKGMGRGAGMAGRAARSTTRRA